ncbi:MAG: hypothetical protein WBB85_20170, partial [Albidovulum sp.]|uniref:hypothetical protein n=1 Tax=Albidovulum sp. TaxID=1872424 RepID=UPI003CB9F660
VGAEQVMLRAMKDLNARLSEMQQQAEADDSEALMKSARRLVKVADQIGMTTFAVVALDVIDATKASNSVAQAATLARLLRIGDRSLNAVWDLRDMTL